MFALVPDGRVGCRIHTHVYIHLTGYCLQEMVSCAAITANKRDTKMQRSG